MKFSQMTKLGDFIFEHSGHLVLNDKNEILQLKPLRNRIKKGYSLIAEQLTIPGKKQDRKITFLSNTPSKTILLIKDETSQTLHFGTIIPKENQGHCLRLNPKYQIQSIKIIQKFNLVAICCYSEQQGDNKVMLVNMKTGEDLCNSKSMSSIPQQILYIEQQEIIIIGSSQLGRSNNKCQVNIYKLINEEGLVGMESLKTY